MKFLSLLAAAALASAQTSDYFMRLIGGNAVTNNAFLHRNWTANISPIAVPAPLSPSDHYYRIQPSPALDSASQLGAPLLANGKLTVVPTQPHPGPLASYLSLSRNENIADMLRMTTSVYPASNNMVFDGWTAVRDAQGRALLRYSDPASQSRWIAVKTNTTQGYEGWAPWWVAPNAENMAVLEEWDWVLVDIELVPATGLVNSSAPFGTN
ncbi:Band 3 anion exchange protein [Ceratocystis lukuohia]|uniref:Band 3 anion exchange protein n=1 Tax=Ceratocystis lukuohia TaxID=2019550 RepID=A0ABR4MFA5_9PEZI